MNGKATSTIQRIEGRLHLIRQVTDDEGNPIATTSEPLKVEFHFEDLLQLIAGALLMGLPVAMAEDTWKLGADLSTGRTLTVVALSLCTLAGFIWALFYGKRITEYRDQFFKRTAAAYVVTFAVSFLLLLLFDKAPVDDLRLALTRTVLVAFPASFAATAVDFVK